MTTTDSTKTRQADEARLSVILDMDAKAKIEALAGLHSRSVSAEVRVALEAHFARNAGGLRYALRVEPERVSLIGADGRRVVRGVGRGYAEELAASLTLATGEAFEIVPDPAGGSTGAPSTLAAAAA